MTKALVTFIGGPECGNVGETVWGNEYTGEVTFPIRVPVLIDTDAAKTDAERDFLAHLLKKARTNRFFTVEEADTGAGEAVRVAQPPPRPRLVPNKPRGKKPEVEAA